MENKILILIKIITLLFLNDQLDEPPSDFSKEVDELLKDIRVDPKALSGLGGEEAVIEALLETATWMMLNVSGGYTKEDLIQRLSINMQSNHEYIIIAKESLVEIEDQNKLLKRINVIKRELRHSIQQNTLKKTIAKANAIINFGDGKVDQKKFIDELKNDLEKVQVTEKGKIPGLIDRIDFSDLDSIAKALKKGKTRLSVEGVINTGFIGINRAAGGLGFFRGDLVANLALPENCKTLFLTLMSIWIPFFNVPWMMDKKKKPLLLYFSYENTTEQLIISVYKILYELKHQKKLDPSEIDIELASKTVMEHIGRNGYKMEFIHLEKDTDVGDIISISNDYIAAGFEIHAMMIDYLELIAENILGDKMDTKLPRAYDLVRGYCNPRGILAICPGQLNSDAKKLSRVEKTNFTKQLRGGGYYKACNTLDAKFDLEFFHHIINHLDGKKYLSFSRGKQRAGGEDTPEKYLHFLYEFSEFGGILPDYGMEEKVLYTLPRVLDPDVNIDWDKA